MKRSTDAGLSYPITCSRSRNNDIAVGQFYQVSADMRRPYYVCGGLQDNNAWCGPSALRSNTGPVNTDWYTVAGGDGFFPAPGTDYSVGDEPELAARLNRMALALHLHLIGLSGYRSPEHSAQSCASIRSCLASRGRPRRW